MDKLKTRILLISLILVLLFSFQGVSAVTDDNGNLTSESIDLSICDNEGDVSSDKLSSAYESNNPDDVLSASSELDVLSVDEVPFTTLEDEISSTNENVELLHDYYRYQGSGSTISIYGDNRIIDGRGAVIDMAGSTIRAFNVYGSGITIKNLTIKNANYNGDGGAIYFSSSGTVENCNFTGNKAKYGGVVYFNSKGTVSNCNFTNNTASEDGGAVYFNGTGEVTNCNFTDNKATSSSGGSIWFTGNGDVINCIFTNNSATGDGGAVYFYEGATGRIINCNFTNNQASGNGGAVNFYVTGNVTNCNFTNNKATGYYSNGGAVYFQSTSNVTNCNFADNSAYRGGDIFSWNWYTAADTCIFKRNSGDNFNVVIYPPTLNVDNFTTFYGSGEKLTFNLTTDSGMPVNNGNISISVYFKDNNSWVRNYSCLSGEGWTVSLPVGSYYANFTTEYAGFQAISRTIKIIPNIPYYVNVTPVTTNNRTVNITAKSNIPNDVVQGKLLFILPNGDEINATYASNGTWWAVHTFDDYADYQVNASYVGLDNVTITNATISITKANSTVNVSDVVLNYGESTNVTVTAEGAKGINATIDNKPVTVINNYTIVISDLAAGNYTLTVTTIADDDHNNVTKTVNVTVNKVNSTLTVNNLTFDYKATGSVEVSFTGATGVNASVVNQPKATVNVNNNTITVSGLDAGTYTLTVTTITDVNHNNITKNATIIVNKLQTQLTGNAITATYNINKDLVITLKDANGNALSGVNVIVDLNGAKTLTTDKNGQVKVSTKGLAPKTYTAKVTFNGNANYVKSTKDVKVTVKKATPKLTAKKKTFKSSVKTKKYTMVLKDNTGKAIKKAKVTLKVKGKTYKATTNTKGKAVFKIKNLKKKGKYTAVIKFKGNKYYNKATKKAKIKVIVTFKTVSKGSKDKATVREIQQALKNNGYYLTYDGHYLKIDGIYHGCTERSVKEFQKDKGLKVTGKVDEKTAKKLGII